MEFSEKGILDLSVRRLVLRIVQEELWRRPKMICDF
jgi:hypothetical protein